MFLDSTTRNFESKTEREFLFGPFRLISSERLLLRNDQAVVLGSRAFEILKLLVCRRGEVVSGRDILKQVWANIAVEDANLRTQISHLRTALGCRAVHPTYIATVRGQGYSFVAPVEHRTTAQPARVMQARLPMRLRRLLAGRGLLDGLHGHRNAERLISIAGNGGIGKRTLVADALLNELVLRQLLSAVKARS
jgi:DNA-binding winged helix-turn-helix (wHTH) protein